MPIKSYLAYPLEGNKQALIEALQALDNCEVTPSENEELLIVVTDTETLEEDLILKEKIDAIESLKMLSLVSGFNTPKNN
jgi:nitrate reductase NapAB chaperone NapD